jgi:hypothetical protein
MRNDRKIYGKEEIVTAYPLKKRKFFGIIKYNSLMLLNEGDVS